MSVGFCGSLINNFSMSVGCLWDSICTKRKDLQCLWGSVGLQYNKKKYLQCLWGSVVVLIIIFQCLWDVCGTQYTKKNQFQCLWGSVRFCGTPYILKETFAMSVGFCGTPVY